MIERCGLRIDDFLGGRWGVSPAGGISAKLGAPSELLYGSGPASPPEDMNFWM